MASFMKHIERRLSNSSGSTTSTVMTSATAFEKQFFEEPSHNTVEGDHILSETGQTKIVSKYLYSCVCFTLNNYSDEDLKRFRDACKRGLVKILFYQHEIGINKTRHLQGFMHLNRRMRLSGLKYTFGNKVHFEKAFGTPKQNWTYCTKEETRDLSVEEPVMCYPSLEEVQRYLEHATMATAGRYVKLREIVDQIVENKEIDKTERNYVLHKRAIHEVVAEIRNDNLMKKLRETVPDPTGWQLECLQQLKDQTDRQVLWVYESKGCVGKSELSKWLMVHSKYIKLSSISSMNRVAFIINKNSAPGIIFDMPRSNNIEGDKMAISYGTLEQLKDGTLFSDRYEGLSSIIDVPRIVVFCNFPPDKDKLSLDRWCIFRIDNNKLIREI